MLRKGIKQNISLHPVGRKSRIVVSVLPTEVHTAERCFKPGSTLSSLTLT